MFSQFVFSRPQCVKLAEDQVLQLKGRSFEITCLAGLVWITDGAGGDRIVQGGQQATLSSKGRICVQAFAPSVVRIQAPCRDRAFLPAACASGVETGPVAEEQSATVC